MRAANLSKHLYGLFIFIFAICLFPVFPPVAQGATLADLAGSWNANGFATGPDAPWWTRGTLTVASDGTFTLSGTGSDGKVVSGSGAFSISSDGIAITVNNGDITPPLCQINSYNTVLSCTETWSDGSTNLLILTKQAASYSQTDLAGTWQQTYLSSGPTCEWASGSVTTAADGTYTGSLTLSDNSTIPTSGQTSISSDGVITCVTGDCLNYSNFGGFMDAGKNVMVATSGASTDSEDAVLYVFTKQAASYSMADLAGTWQGNSLASGPGAPFWDRVNMKVNPDGTAELVTENDSSGHTHKNESIGSLGISSNGVVTISSTQDLMSGVMDAGKTVMVWTDTWVGNTDPGTTGIVVFTKSAAAGPVVPGAPTNVTAKAGNAQATVSFTPPPANGSGITHYTVTASDGKTTATGKGSPITVKGLTNGNSYAFTVTATNGVGTGPASGSSNSVTPTGPSVPGSPTIVSVTPGDAQVTVNFTLPSNGGSPIKSYTVISNPGGKTASGAGSPIVVKGLTNGTPYTFTVTATNKIGTGPASSASNSATPIGPTVPGAPTAVTATSGNAQATVTFTTPAANGSNITGYTITSSPDASHPSGITAKGTKSPITVKGLTNGTQYTFTVTSTNKIGTGPASSASNAVTPGTKPHAPTIGVINVGVGQATVNFTEKSDGGRPTTYTVTSNPSGGVDGSAGTSSLNHLVTNLTSGKKYTFTVMATNAFGSSSSTSKSVTIK